MNETSTKPLDRFQRYRLKILADPERRDAYKQKKRAYRAEWEAKRKSTPESTKAWRKKQREYYEHHKERIASDQDYAAQVKAQTAASEKRYRERAKLDPIKVARRKEYLAKIKADGRAAMWAAKTRAKQYATSPRFRLRITINSSLSQAFREFGFHPDRRWHCEEYLGCTFAEFMAHIERQFLPGMTWANRGKGKGKWHVDHIRPLASFVGTDESMKEAYHFSNLRPLWSEDNVRKHSVWNGKRWSYKDHLPTPLTPSEPVLP